MIIRMTVSDNDFTKILESFALELRTIRTDNALDDMTYIDVLSDVAFSKNECENIIPMIESRFEYFLQQKSDEEFNNEKEKTIDFLLKYFEVSLVRKFDYTQDENGECVYYFIRDDKFITL